MIHHFRRDPHTCCIYLSGVDISCLAMLREVTTASHMEMNPFWENMAMCFHTSLFGRKPSLARPKSGSKEGISSGFNTPKHGRGFVGRRFAAEKVSHQVSGDPGKGWPLLSQLEAWDRWATSSRPFKNFWVGRSARRARSRVQRSSVRPGEELKFPLTLTPEEQLKVKGSNGKPKTREEAPCNPQCGKGVLLPPP